MIIECLRGRLLSKPSTRCTSAAANLTKPVPLGKCCRAIGRSDQRTKPNAGQKKSAILCLLAMQIGNYSLKHW